MPFGGLWENLFAGAPQTVASDYSNMQRNQLINQILANQAQYAPQMSAANLQKLNLNNQILGNTAQYAPQVSQATLQGLDLRNQGQAISNQYAPQLKQLAVQKAALDNAVQSQTFQNLPASQQAALKLQQAKLNLINAQVTALPQQMAEKAKQDAFYRSALYNLPKFVKMQSGSAKDTFIANNQDALNNLMVNTLNQANQAVQTPVGISPGAQSQMPPAGAGIVPMGASLGGQNAQSVPNLPPVAPVAPMAPASPPIPSGMGAPNQQQSVNQQQFANQILANKGAVSPYITKKLDNSIEIEKFLASPATQTLAESAAKYAGILGKGQAFIDQWKTTNPKDYENYLQFGNSFTSNISNQIKNIENLSIQPSQRQEIIGNFRKSFDEWSSNPARALDQYNRAMAQLKDVAGATSIAAQPLYPGVREKMLGLPPPSANNLSDYIKSSRPGFIYVQDSQGNKGYISQNEWSNSTPQEQSQYKRIG
jgi:hypothetical protein